MGAEVVLLGVVGLAAQPPACLATLVEHCRFEPALD